MTKILQCLIIIQIYMLVPFPAYATPLQSKALIDAIKMGDDNAVVQLISNGSNPNMIDDKGITPLMWASLEGKEKIVDILLRSTANINMSCTSLNLSLDDPIKYRDTSLIVATKRGHVKVVKTLVMNGADLNIKGSINKTALLIAVENGNLEIISTLINAGANINSKGGVNNSTPLIEAVRNGDYKSVKLLLTEDAEIDVVDKNDKTALNISKELGFSKIYNILINKGAKVTNSVYVKIFLLLSVFFISLSFSYPAIKRIIPIGDSSYNNWLALATSLSLSVLFIAVSWDKIDQLNDFVVTLFTGFLGLSNTFLALLFLSIATYLFFRHIVVMFIGMKK